MSLTLGLLADALTRSLKEGHVADSLLDRALVEPYDFENGDPSGLIVRAGEGAGAMAMDLLRKILVEKMSTLSLKQMRSGADPAHELMRANTLFDLARSLFVEEQTPGREQVILVLERVWQEHIDWRKAAGETFQRGEELIGWVDPATTAEESLLVLVSKHPLVLKIRVEDILKLVETKCYPSPMADYACYSSLVYVVNYYKKNTFASVLEAAGYIFGRCAVAWLNNNRFLLDYVLFHVMDIVHQDEYQKNALAASLYSSASEYGMDQKVWNELVTRCKYLKMLSVIASIGKKRQGSLSGKFYSPHHMPNHATPPREAVCAL
ncbi:MAG: hypothetical protein H7839_05585 [Magnetococcus sp. YQC-5]